MKSNQKISIITATYNSASTVSDSLKSVAKQSYLNIEHIIIDGKSKDETLSLVKQYDHVSKIISEKDKGIYDAMNKGIQLSSGEIIGILNSDDIYENEHVIENVMQAFDEDDVDAVYGDLVYVDPIDTNKIVRVWKGGKYKNEKWLNGWMPPHPTFFLKKSTYQQYGSFNLSLKSSADYELMLRLLYKHQIKVKYLPITLVKMRTGGQSNISLKNRLKANKEDQLAWEINGLKTRPFTTILKPIRKIPQYFRKYK